MLQVAFIKTNKDLVVDRLKKRGVDAKELVEEIISLDDKRIACQVASDKVNSTSNQLAKQIGELFKSGQGEKANVLKEEAAKLKQESATYKEEAQEVSVKLKNALYQLPNVPNEIVPAGKSDEDNEEVSRFGDIPKLLNAQPHWELAKKYDIIDFDLGAKISGAGFPVYKGKGAALQRALINFFLTSAIAEGYEEVIPPLVVNEDSGYGTGQLPDKEGQMYHITEDDLYLIPTAEVPITNIYRDVIVGKEQFPIKHVGYTPCFRREAGSYGAHVRGLNRLHQFDKVEIVQVQDPSKSYDSLDEMVGYVEGLLKQLNLPYRKLRLCGGDLGFTAALTYDLEVYSAAQDRWLEVSSISNFEAFQANRLKCRFKNKEGKTELVHTLNGSALALPRIVAAILENNQTQEGIVIPEVLRKYTGFDLIK